MTDVTERQEVSEYCAVRPSSLSVITAQEHTRQIYNRQIYNRQIYNVPRDHQIEGQYTNKESLPRQRVEHTDAHHRHARMDGQIHTQNTQVHAHTHTNIYIHTEIAHSQIAVTARG